jgi:predicted HicB family RNase H-like nuclease
LSSCNPDSSESKTRQVNGGLAVDSLEMRGGGNFYFAVYHSCKRKGRALDNYKNKIDVLESKIAELQAGNKAVQDDHSAKIAQLRQEKSALEKALAEEQALRGEERKGYTNDMYRLRASYSTFSCAVQSALEYARSFLKSHQKPLKLWQYPWGGGEIPVTEYLKNGGFDKGWAVDSPDGWMRNGNSLVWGAFDYRNMDIEMNNNQIVKLVYLYPTKKKDGEKYKFSEIKCNPDGMDPYLQFEDDFLVTIGETYDCQNKKFGWKKSDGTLVTLDGGTVTLKVKFVT